MKAIRLAEIAQPLIEAELGDPEVGDGSILVRVEAAGICRSDIHYRAGFPKLAHLPITLGHEVAGTVEAVGGSVETLAVGDRVALHYLVTCGECRHCAAGHEQFCRTQVMLGKDTDGGFAQLVVVPEANAFAVPGGVPATTAAVMMCSTATSFHALRKSPDDILAEVIRQILLIAIPQGQNA